MGIRKLKSATPGQRHRTIGAFNVITTSILEKSLVIGARRPDGRSNTNKMTIRNVGGGHEHKYRLISFRRMKDDIPVIAKNIEYDPDKSSRITLLYHADGAKSCVIAPNELIVGQQVMSDDNTTPEIDNALPLAKVSVGMTVRNIELHLGQGGKLARSAGTFAQLVAREDNYVILCISSEETRRILVACKTMIGGVGSSDHVLERSSKAGRTR